MYRNYHTSHALGPIQETTQLFLDVYRHKDELYVRPVKVQHRYSPTMNMLHVWRRRRIPDRHLQRRDLRDPDLGAVVGPRLRQQRRASGRPASSGPASCSSRASTGPTCPAGARDIYDTLVRMIISRDANMQRLISRYLTLQDILDVRKRMIGTGLIGGKTVGMLLARAILRKTGPRFADLLEEHDSFYIGSDVFYDFLVRNGVWWVRQKQRDPQHFLDGAEQARRRILTGEFPPHILRRLEEMLDYFGQSPFIVRSSSLLEDNYGNSFAGKYESVFCANQGPREQRLQDLLAAIRTIYASTMSEKALRYRADRGLLDRDEQMALLVMRVSGAMYDRHFYPQVAGVGFSFNPYVWDRDIDPKAGVVRLVFGLGTRAVNRSDDDYTRVVALNAPEKRPEANFDEVAQFAQRRVDYLDLEANQLVSSHFLDLIQNKPDLPLRLFASTDRMHAPDDPRRAGADLRPAAARHRPRREPARDAADPRRRPTSIPVDIEFTANFTDDGRYKINLLQCRPLQVQGAAMVELPKVQVKNEGPHHRGARRGHRPEPPRHGRPLRLRLAQPVRPAPVAGAPRGRAPHRRDQPHRRRGHPHGDDARARPLGQHQPPSRRAGDGSGTSTTSRSSARSSPCTRTWCPTSRSALTSSTRSSRRNILYLALFPQQGDNFLSAGLLRELAEPSLGTRARRGGARGRGPGHRLGAGGERRLDPATADAIDQSVLCYFERPSVSLAICIAHGGEHGPLGQSAPARRRYSSIDSAGCIVESVYMPRGLMAESTSTRVRAHRYPERSTEWQTS